jgi:O-antigen ligase
MPLGDNPYDWDVQFSEFRDFCLLIPAFAVVGTVLRTRASWRGVILSFFAMNVYVAGMGVLEYVVPGVRELLPGFVSDATASITADGFARARFSFWGGPHATFGCALALPLMIPVWRWWPAPWPRAATLAGVGLQLAAIYVGGYRSMWLLTGILAFLFALVEKRFVLGLVALLAALTGHQSLPAETQARLDSLRLVLQGQPIDSSGIERKQRVLEALAATWEQPLGNGWAASGWVHSDFIQVAANLGVLAGLLFFAGYLATLWRLWLRVQPRQTDDSAALNLALFLCFVAAGGIMVVEGVQILPQMILPIWLIWGLAESSLRQMPFAAEQTLPTEPRLPEVCRRHAPGVYRGAA